MSRTERAKLSHGLDRRSMADPSQASAATVPQGSSSNGLPPRDCRCNSLRCARGCPWRLLPHDFPNWKTVYGIFHTWRNNGTWQKIHDSLRDAVRRQDGRKTSPSAAIIDSQTVKTTEVGGERGYDAGKKINGRKRHIVVDTMGLILAVVVHAANIQDYDGAVLVYPSCRAAQRAVSPIEGHLCRQCLRSKQSTRVCENRVWMDIANRASPRTREGLCGAA